MFIEQMNVVKGMIDVTLHFPGSFLFLIILELVTELKLMHLFIPKFIDDTNAFESVLTSSTCMESIDQQSPPPSF